MNEPFVATKASPKTQRGSVEEEIRNIFKRLGEITFDTSAQETLAIAEQNILGVVAQQEARWKDDAKKLQAMYELVRDKRTQYWKELQDLKKAEAERNKNLTELLKEFPEPKMATISIGDEDDPIIYQPKRSDYLKWRKKFEALFCEGKGKSQPPKTEAGKP